MATVYIFQKFGPGCIRYMIVHGMGMQQHSKPSHSMHLVLPGCVPAGLTIESMDSIGLTKSTGTEGMWEFLHMVFKGSGLRFGLVLVVG